MMEETSTELHTFVQLTHIPPSYQPSPPSPPPQSHPACQTSPNLRVLAFQVKSEIKTRRVSGLRAKATRDIRAL